ncbi:hypothetical protein, partial [Pseudomonas aeruginosa]|uniref:hypothetical protein n=1 Tax=Pseudomonas aeruginosa TaxID=287 RepID=UPI0025B1CE56
MAPLNVPISLALAKNYQQKPHPKTGSNPYLSAITYEQSPWNAWRSGGFVFSGERSGIPSAGRAKKPCHG